MTLFGINKVSFYSMSKNHDELPHLYVLEGQWINCFTSVAGRDPKRYFLKFGMEYSFTQHL